MWVKLDDGFADHPKVVGLSHQAYRVFVNGLCYANRYQTDGVLSVAAQRHLFCPRTIATELVRAGMWEIHKDGAFLIHDYAVYQPTKAAAQEIRAKRAAAGRLGGLASGEARREANASAGASSKREAKTNPVPGPVPVPVGFEKTRGRREGLRPIGDAIARVTRELSEEGA